MEEVVPGIEPEEVEEQEEATTSEEPEESTEETEEEATEEEDEKEKPEPKGVQKRINQLVKEREEEKRRAERLEQMLHEMYSKSQQQPKEEAKQQVEYPDSPPLPPDRYEYDTDEEYKKQLQKYQSDLSLYVQGQNKRAQQELINQVTQSKQQQTVQSFINETVTKGTEKYEDFRQVAFIPAGMEQIFQQADNVVDIAYYLGKHQNEAGRIMGLRPEQAAFEVAKLDAKFSRPPEKTVTRAPAPVRPVGGREPATNNILDLPVDEFIKARNKQQYGG